MGGESICERNFENFQLMEATYDDMRFGPVTIYFNPEDETDIIAIKTKRFTTLEEFNQKLAIAEERLRFNSPYILKMLYVRPNEEDLSIEICFEYPNEDLISKALDLKNPNEVLKMLHDLLSGMSFLERVKMIHGNIRPEYIYFNPKMNSYILLDRLGENLTPNQIQHDNIFNNNYLYLDPLVFVNLYQNNLYFAHNPFKSESFSLGMVLLSMIVYDGPEHNNHLTVQDLYDREAAAFNEHRFLVLLQQIRAEYFQSPDHELVFDFITDCLLNLDTSQRLTPYKAYKLLRETLWKISTSNLGSLTHSGVRGLQDSGIRNEFVANIETKTLGARSELTDSDLSNARDSGQNYQKMLESEHYFEVEHQDTLQSSQFYDPQPPADSEVMHVDFRAGPLNEFVEPHFNRVARHNNESNLEQTVTDENFNLVDAQHLISARNSDARHQIGWTEGLDPAILHSNAFFNVQAPQNFFHGQTNLTEPNTPVDFFGMQPPEFSYSMPQHYSDNFGEQPLFNPSVPLYDKTTSQYDQNASPSQRNHLLDEPPVESGGNFFNTTDLAKEITDSYRPSETLGDQDLLGKQSEYHLEPAPNSSRFSQQRESNTVSRPSQQSVSNGLEHGSQQQIKVVQTSQRSIRQNSTVSGQQSTREAPQENPGQEPNIFAQQYETSLPKVDDFGNQSMSPNGFFQTHGFGYSQSFNTSNIPFGKNDLTFAQTQNLLASNLNADSEKSGLIRVLDGDEQQGALKSQVKEESFRLASGGKGVCDDEQKLVLSKIDENPEAAELPDLNGDNEDRKSRSNQTDRRGQSSNFQSENQMLVPESQQVLRLHSRLESTAEDLRNYSHNLFPSSPDILALRESLSNQNHDQDSNMKAGLPQLEGGAPEQFDQSTGPLVSKRAVENQGTIVNTKEQNYRLSNQRISVNEADQNVHRNSDNTIRSEKMPIATQQDFVFRESVAQPLAQNPNDLEYTQNDPNTLNSSRDIENQRQSALSYADPRNKGSVFSNRNLDQNFQAISDKDTESNPGRVIILEDTDHMFRRAIRDSNVSSRLDNPLAQTDQSQIVDNIHQSFNASNIRVLKESIPGSSEFQEPAPYNDEYDSQADLKLPMSEVKRIINVQNQSVETSKMDDSRPQGHSKKKKKDRSITPEKLSKNNLSKMMGCLMYDSISQSLVTEQHSLNNQQSFNLQNRENVNQPVALQANEQRSSKTARLHEGERDKKRSVSPERLSKSNLNKVIDGVIDGPLRIDETYGEHTYSSQNQRERTSAKGKVFHNDGATVISSIQQNAVRNQHAEQDSWNKTNKQHQNTDAINEAQDKIASGSAGFDITEEAISQRNKGIENRPSDNSMLLNEIKMLDASQRRANTHSLSIAQNGIDSEHIKKHSSLPSKVNDTVSFVPNHEAIDKIYEEIEHEEAVDYDYSHSKKRIHSQVPEVPISKQVLHNNKSVRGSAELESYTPKMSLQMPELQEFNDMTSRQQTNSFVTHTLSANFNEGDNDGRENEIEIRKKIPAKRMTEGEVPVFEEDTPMRDSKRPSLYKKGSSRILVNPTDVKIPPLVNPAQYNFKKTIDQQELTPRSHQVMFIKDFTSPFIKPQQAHVMVNKPMVEYRSYNPPAIPVGAFVQNFSTYALNKPNMQILPNQAPQQQNIRVLSRTPDMIPRNNGQQDLSAKVIYFQQPAQGFAKVVEDQPSMPNSLAINSNAPKNLPVTKDGKIIINCEDFKAQTALPTDSGPLYKQNNMNPRVPNFNTLSGIVYNAPLQSNYSIPLSQSGASQKGIVFVQQNIPMAIKQPIQTMQQPFAFSSNNHQNYGSNYSNSSKGQNPQALIHQNLHSQVRLVNAPSTLPLKSEKPNNEFFNFHKNAPTLNQYQSNPLQNNSRPSLDSNRKIARDASPIRTAYPPQTHQNPGQSTINFNASKQVINHGSNSQVIYMNQQPIQNYHSNSPNVVYDFSKKIPNVQPQKVTTTHTNGPVPQPRQVIYTQQIHAHKQNGPIQPSTPQTFGQEHFKPESKLSTETNNRSRTPSRQINQSPQQFTKGVTSSQMLASGHDLVHGKQHKDSQRPLTPTKVPQGLGQSETNSHKD